MQVIFSQANAEAQSAVEKAVETKAVQVSTLITGAC